LNRHILFKGESPIEQLDKIIELLGTPSEEDASIGSKEVSQRNKPGI
jgi:hypothetical protein